MGFDKLGTRGRHAFQLCRTRLPDEKSLLSFGNEMSWQNDPNRPPHRGNPRRISWNNRRTRYRCISLDCSANSFRCPNSADLVGMKKHSEEQDLLGREMRKRNPNIC